MIKTTHHPFNLNDTIKFKITERGMQIWKAHNAALQEKIPIEICEFKVDEPDADGYYRMQMWEICQMFGAHMYNGGQVPIETNVIIETSEHIFEEAPNETIPARTSECEEVRRET